ncbi:NAD(P)H-dependent flavin oxidoreductase [Sorangium sp. So ce131]|uniref:NAD(P)H-dependent flavin oxidoreductase n=1 Tax=Sorangium sp. So ce131 TaxID=3133282 RepID=UPI003F63BA7E
MWTKTRVTGALGIELPILQGPFGGGHSTAALAAAVSNAGGLGSFGAVNLPPEDIERTVQDIAGRTSRPFALNLWVPIPGQDDAHVSEPELARIAGRLRPYFEQLGLAEPRMPDRFAPRFEAQAEALIKARPPAFSFVMGVPDRAILAAARARGIKTLGTATTVEEAAALADAGVDVVVASGSDAGGHRGSFLRPVEASLVGTMSLVPQVAAAVGVPVVAAGGIADGRGIAAALALGAEGVQIGSAFLATPESGAPAVHKELLGTPRARVTRLTRVFSGRHARGIENELMLALADHLDEILPYPAQNWLTSPLRRAAGAAGRADLLALWAGQNAASARRLPAAELLRTLVEETDHVLRDPRLRPRAAPPAV